MERSCDRATDLRARISAGDALGALGDHRFEERHGPLGLYRLPPMVAVEGGTYTIGSNDDEDTRPADRVELAPFSLGQFPVTNAEYRCFAEKGYKEERWWESEAALRWLAEIDKNPGYWDGAAYNGPNQPVVGVCWYEARAYCAWLSAQTGQPFRLPTEEEWEAAARGKDGRRYAWGKDFDAARCNMAKTGVMCTTPVGVFPEGDTPAGAKQNRLADMTGNVSEWTSSAYDHKNFPFPYSAKDGRENVEGDGRRVARGGSWYLDAGSARCACRHWGLPGGRSRSIGFRVVLPSVS